MKRSRKPFFSQKKNILLTAAAVLCVLVIALGAAGIVRSLGEEKETAHRAETQPATGSPAADAETNAPASLPPASSAAPSSSPQTDPAPQTDPETVHTEPFAAYLTPLTDRILALQLAHTAARDLGSKVVVSANGYLNIRQAPESTAPVIGKIYRGCAADLLEHGQAFSRIRSGAVEGWVSNDYILFGKAAEQFAAENGAYSATVLAEHLNIREKPSDTSTILATVDKGQDFIVLSLGETWVKVFYTSSIEGYLSREFVEISLDTGSAVSLEEEKELLALYQKKSEERESKAEESREAESRSRAAESSRAAKTSKSSDKTTKARETTKAPKTTEAPPPETQAPPPSTQAPEVSTDDLHLLAAICQAEAGYTYDLCLPVAIVVMNRVRSSKFPNTVSGVIYQSGQFSPVKSGRLDKILTAGPKAGPLEAAAAAMGGVRDVGGEDFPFLYFCLEKNANYDIMSEYRTIGTVVYYNRK